MTYQTSFTFLSAILIAFTFIPQTLFSKTELPSSSKYLQKDSKISWNITLGNMSNYIIQCVVYPLNSTASQCRSKQQVPIGSSIEFSGSFSDKCSGGTQNYLEVSCNSVAANRSNVGAASMIATNGLQIQYLPAVFQITTITEKKEK